ncbi:MAG: hypothetical protein ABI414_02520 [Devosia sp.]
MSDVAQYRVTAEQLAGRRRQRYFYQAWVETETGRNVHVRGAVEANEHPTEDDFIAFARDKARRSHLHPKSDGAVEIETTFALLPVPRLPESDQRPVLSWLVNIYFVCHDVKFGGYGTGIFAWPERPNGSALVGMVALLMSDTLAYRDGQPDGEKYSELGTVDVQPSPEAPTYL